MGSPLLTVSCGHMRWSHVFILWYRDTEVGPCVQVGRPVYKGVETLDAHNI